MTNIKNILTAYLMGFVIVLISFTSLALIGCDTGTSSMSGSGSSSGTIQEEPVNTDPPTTHDIIGRWAVESEVRYFSFLDDNTFTIHQKNVSGVYEITNSGTYVMEYHAGYDGGIHLYDTINDSDGTYWYDIEQDAPEEGEVTLWMTPGWVNGESPLEYIYVDRGNW